MLRRDVIAGLGLGGVVILAGNAGAQTGGTAHSGHGDHVGSDAAAAAAASGRYAKLAESAGHCVAVGEPCLTHCLNLLATGDTGIAGCAKQVRQLIASCQALHELAAAESGYVPAFAKVVEMVCKDCEAECRKHEAHHAICRACAEACKSCAEECGRVAA